MISKKALKKARYNARRKHRCLNALLAAALSIPGLGISGAQAQSTPEPSEIRFQYGTYSDYQNNSRHRITVNTPSAWIKTHLDATTEIEASGVIDTYSGASPLYLDSMSGASGSGISDRRRAADVKLTHSFERWSIGVGAAGSTENDYDSQSLSIDGKWWTSDKNTTIAAGIASDSDDIYSTNDPTFADTKKTLHYFLGVTQVVSPDTIVQSNLSYENANGYLSEPYKPLDHRPRSRDSLAWLTRYNHYLSELDASLHTDYRLYGDSFGIVSHMVEIALYKPVGETWLLRPNLRYYTQSHARFFSGTFPPRTSDAFFSADQRMSTFGGVTVGFKAEKELGAGWSANGSMDYLEQRQEWAPGGGSKAPIGRFVAPFFTLGISKKF